MSIIRAALHGLVSALSPFLDSSGSELEGTRKIDLSSALWAKVLGIQHLLSDLPESLGMLAFGCKIGNRPAKGQRLNLHDGTLQHLAENHFAQVLFDHSPEILFYPPSAIESLDQVIAPAS